VAYILGYLPAFSFRVSGLLISFIIKVEGVHTLSRLSESPSCWYLRVTLTPERPSYHSSIVHLLHWHPAHPSQIQAHTKADIAEFKLAARFS
jgi:hypothetical protein